MEWIMELFSDGIVAVLGLALTWLGSLLGRWLREKMQEDTLRRVALTCVQAVEQMYKEANGEEKLKRALIMGEKMLQKKGLSISAEELRILLEAALAQVKGAFDAV